MNLKFGKNVNYTSILCFSLDTRVTFFTKTPVRLSHTDKLPLTADPAQKTQKDGPSRTSDLLLAKILLMQAGYAHQDYSLLCK